MDNNKGEAVDQYTLTVAGRLLDAKNQSGLSFTALAEATGLGRATVVRVLNGERNVTLNYLKLICDALGLDIGEVVEHADRLMRRDEYATDCPPVDDPEGDEGEWDASVDPATLRQSDYGRAAHETIDDDGSDDNN